MSLRLARRLSSGTFGAVLAACLATVLALPAAAQTMVRVQTPKGPIDIALTDAETPLTVANFLGYVRRNQYDSSFFHRLATGFVLQGGGFAWNDAASPKLTTITAQPPVLNEYSPTRPNVRGTVAMAKVGATPPTQTSINSATNQWFINLKDNTTILNESQNGGFTVFGRVTTPSMAVVDVLAAYGTVGATGCSGVFGGNTSAFNELPVSPRPATCGDVSAASLAMVTSARELPARATLSDSDRVFNYLEAAFPQYVAPASSASATAAGYYYRFYAQSNAYVGVKDGQVWYIGPATQNTLLALGSQADWLGVATAAGY